MLDIALSIGGSVGSFLKDWAPTAQALVTTMAVLAAGLWAVWRVLSFRELKGFLVVTQSVSHVQVADGTMHLQVVATLTNRSRVFVRPDKGFCYIAGVRLGVPLDTFRAAAEEHDGNPMEYVDSKELSTSVDLEPGEEIQYEFDFLIDGEYQYLRSHVYIKDPAKRGDSEWGMGWEAIELYSWR